MNLMRLALLLTLGFCSAAPSFAADEPAGDLYVACLDTVWTTVNENHFDPTFGGMDWRAIHDRYAALVRGVHDDAAFMELANGMLQELGLSHYSVFTMREKAASGSPVLSAGSLGLDIRLLGGRAVVSSVKPGFPAAGAGLRPGYIIESVDGVPIPRLLAEAEPDLPPYLNERGRLNSLADRIANRFYGAPGTAVGLGYRDAEDALHEVALEMQPRPGKTVIDESFPPLYVDFTARRLPGDIGYVAFSAFFPPVGERFGAALDSMPGIRGLVIDIRGNPGGSHEIGETIASRLVREPTLFSVFRFRDRTERVTVEPASSVFDGPTVILIDVMNGSASERFSACMQSIGRAVVIGERSPGLVGPSDIKQLPNGSSFMYLVAQSTTPDGTVLEGRGVIPDIVVSWDREALLAGQDAQMQRALDYIDAATR